MDFRNGCYKGTDRAKAGTIVQDRPTRPFVDALWGPHHPLTEGDQLIIYPGLQVRAVSCKHGSETILNSIIRPKLKLRRLGKHINIIMKIPHHTTSCGMSNA